MAATLGLFKHLVKQLGYSPRQLQQQIHQCSTGSSCHLVLCSPSRWWKLVRQGEHPMCFSVPNTPYGQVILFSSSHNCSPRFQYQLSSWESGPEPILVRKPFWYLAHFYLCAISQLQWTFCVDSASLQRTFLGRISPAPLEHTCTRWKGIHNPWSCGSLLSWPYSSQQITSCPIEISWNLDEKLWNYVTLNYFNTESVSPSSVYPLRFDFFLYNR